MPKRNNTKPVKPKVAQVKLETYGDNNEFVKPANSDLPPINLDLLSDVPLIPPVEQTESEEGKEDTIESKGNDQSEVNSNRAKQGIIGISQDANWVNVEMSKSRNLILEHIADESVFIISLEKKVNSEKEALNFNPFQLKFIEDKETKDKKVRVNMLLSKEGFRALLMAFAEMVDKQNLNLED